MQPFIRPAFLSGVRSRCHQCRTPVSGGPFQRYPSTEGMGQHICGSANDFMDKRPDQIGIVIDVPWHFRRRGCAEAGQVRDEARTDIRYRIRQRQHHPGAASPAMKHEQRRSRARFAAGHRQPIIVKCVSVFFGHVYWFLCTLPVSSHGFHSLRNPVPAYPAILKKLIFCTIIRSFFRKLIFCTIIRLSYGSLFSAPSRGLSSVACFLHHHPGACHRMLAYFGSAHK